MKIAICGIESEAKKALAKRMSEELMCPFMEKRTNEWIRSNFFLTVRPEGMPMSMFFRMHEDILFDKIWKESNWPSFVAEGTTIESSIEVAMRYIDEVEAKKIGSNSSFNNDVSRFSEYAFQHAQRAYDLIILIFPKKYETERQKIFMEILSVLLNGFKSRLYILKSQDVENQVTELLWHLGEKGRWGVLSQISGKVC